jgi:hypothetical protein
MLMEFSKQIVLTVLKTVNSLHLVLLIQVGEFLFIPFSILNPIWIYIPALYIFSLIRKDLNRTQEVPL